MQYAVPRIFNDAGCLECFFTDFLAKRGSARVLDAVPKRWQPPAMRRLLSRGLEARDIPPGRTVAFPSLGLRYAIQLSRAKTDDERTAINLGASETFSRRILAHGLGKATHIYAFDVASLGVMRSLQDRGPTIVMEQTNAPRAVMRELLQHEREKHPGWEPPDSTRTKETALQELYEEAWALADQIVCGSTFVLDGIQRCGGPLDKCSVVPYGIDFGNDRIKDPEWRRTLLSERRQRRASGEPLHILTTGSIGLRKGTPYILEAASALGTRAHFRMAGGSDLTDAAHARLSANVELLGLLPRNEVPAQYAWADVFLLPSVCEGSATVTYEALAYGLPVVCTPNTGSVVRDGSDGFVVEVSSASAVIEALETLLADDERLHAMSEAAFATSDQMDVAAYGKRLFAAMGHAWPGTGLMENEAGHAFLTRHG